MNSRRSPAFEPGRAHGRAPRRQEQERIQAEQRSLASKARAQDELSVRAKSSGHKKKTADKWNQ